MTQWTEERRAAAGERLRRGREAAAARRDGLTPTAEQMLIAAAQGNVAMTNEDIFTMQAAGTDGRPTAVAQREPEHQAATITHQTAGKVRVYKPTPQGYSPRIVPASNLPMLIRAGWLAACPDCGRANCSVNGDLNDCPAREPRRFRTCPISTCRKRIWDPIAIGQVEFDEEGHERDPNEINDGAYDLSTPETRTLAMWRAHMLAFHPQESPTYGVYADRVPVTGLNPQVGTEAGAR